MEDLDILVMDEMGKNISGAGMDPNVIGLWRREGGPRRPDYRILIVLDLTPQSHGNALGIGMADMTTQRVIDKIDLQATYTNALTAGVLRGVRIPLHMENDKAVLKEAINLTKDPEQIRMVRILNTHSVETFWASSALLPELRKQEKIEIDDTPLDFKFNEEGRLLPFKKNG